jgi:hypothetical protein
LVFYGLDAEGIVVVDVGDLEFSDGFHWKRKLADWVDYMDVNADSSYRSRHRKNKSCGSIRLDRFASCSWWSSSHGSCLSLCSSSRANKSDSRCTQPNTSSHRYSHDPTVSWIPKSMDSASSFCWSQRHIPTPSPVSHSSRLLGSRRFDSARTTRDKQK